MHIVERNIPLFLVTLVDLSWYSKLFSDLLQIAVGTKYPRLEKCKKIAPVHAI